MDFGRLPPQSIEAEQSVIGCIISEGKLFDDVAEIIAGEDFYKEVHKEIYTAFEELSKKSECIDLVTVSNKLSERGSLENVGGYEYLAKLALESPIASSIKSHCEIIREKAILRRLIKASTSIIEMSYEQQESIENIVQVAESTILSIDEVKGNDICHASQALASAINQIEYRCKNKGKITGVPTGFPDIDYKLGGMQNGDLVVIAARPSMGKTALAENISTYVSAIRKTPVAFFSMEMKKEKIINRQLSNLAMVDNNKIKLGLLEEEDFTKMSKVLGVIGDSKLEIVDTPNLSITEIRSRARRIKKKYGELGLIVVDHLLEMKRPHKGNDVQEFSENVRGCKRLAGEMNCPVILLTQASRQCENRQDKRPGMSDLKECGAIEEVADVVMFIYRDEYYNSKTEKPGIAEIIISKGRDVGTGTIELKWMGQHTKFASLERVVKLPKKHVEGPIEWEQIKARQ